MHPHKRILLLVTIMASIVIVLEVMTIAILYRTALNEEKSRLVETVKSQARLIEGVARFDSLHRHDLPYGANEATLSQIRDAYSKFRGFGNTGEFTLSKKADNQIVFLVNHRHYDLDEPKPVPWNSKLAEPMRQALSGKSGVMVGLDYRGAKVLAAYEPVAGLDLGIVAKIDMAEVRAPFLKAAAITGIIASVLIVLGVSLFFRITNPILKRLKETIDKLKKTLAEVKTLRGILPICTYCKKIREDDGNWKQLEDYVEARSDADFSHGICPDCMKEHFPEEFEKMKGKISSGLGKSRVSESAG